jgi:hypothetical protein
MNKKERKDPAYLRAQGTREARGIRQRKISFSFTKHLPNQGQDINDWDDCGLLGILLNRIRHVGQYTAVEARQNHCIKEYTKVDFPPNSKFKPPTHISGVTWGVMHITEKSKEVVVGYIEDDIFHVVFLDKHHEFWPMT